MYLLTTAHPLAAGPLGDAEKNCAEGHQQEWHDKDQHSLQTRVLNRWHVMFGLSHSSHWAFCVAVLPHEQRDLFQTPVNFQRLQVLFYFLIAHVNNLTYLKKCACFEDCVLSRLRNRFYFIWICKWLWWRLWKRSHSLKEQWTVFPGR